MNFTLSFSFHGVEDVGDAAIGDVAIAYSLGLLSKQSDNKFENKFENEWRDPGGRVVTHCDSREKILHVT